MEKTRNCNNTIKGLLLIAVMFCLLIGFYQPASAATKTSVKVLTVGKTYTIKNAAKVTSSKHSVASVAKKNGNKYKVKALKKGKSTLKVYNKKGKLTKKIYLLAANKKSFKYSSSKVYLEKGKSKTVKATSNISGVTVKYSSSRPSVASVNAKGKITGKSTGGTYITATFYYKGVKAKSVKKTVYVYSSSYDTNALTLSVGESKTVKAKVSDNAAVAYSSSDSSVAAVSSAGKITAKKKGTATITAKIQILGETVKTYSKKVTVKAANTTTEGSGTAANSSGSSSATNNSGSSSSSGSTSSDLNVGDDGYVYTYSTGSKTPAGGATVSVTAYTNKSTDTFEFAASNDCLVMTGIKESTTYDGDRAVTCNFKARIAGSCDVKIYRNGVLVRTITYTITSTDTDYYTYEKWRTDLENELWTATMTDLEKIRVVGDYVFARYPYANESSPYCYAYGEGGDCWASSQLLIDVAHDLGLTAEFYFTNGSTYGHAVALIIIGGKEYYAQNTASSVGEYGYAQILETGR